jgi:hypothetical protein
MGEAGADDRVVGDDGRGAWSTAAARCPENPGLRLPEVIRGQQTVHLLVRLSRCCYASEYYMRQDSGSVLALALASSRLCHSQIAMDHGPARRVLHDSTISG